MLVKNGPSAVALIRALGVADTKNVRSVTLTVAAGQLATLVVERYVDSGAIVQLERLRLRTEPHPEPESGSQQTEADAS